MHDRIAGRQTRGRERCARRPARRFHPRHFRPSRLGAQGGRRRRPWRRRTAIALGAGGTCIAVERADHFVGRRQIGGIGHAHQNHLGGGEWPAGLFDLGHALEQHLPGAREHAHGELFGKGAPAQTLDLGQ